MPRPKAAGEFKMREAERKIAARLKHLPREWHSDPIRRRKFLQLSEAVTLFAKGMEELAKYYPIPRKAIEDFKAALKRGEIAIVVEPGAYLKKEGDIVTKGQIIYSPLKEARLIELPSSAFDEYGNLKPSAVLDLWHELTHAVRGFIPRLERLPTAYDEATTNFIADRLAMLYISKGVEGQYLRIKPEILTEAREAWRRGLVYKPELIEEIIRRLPSERKLEEEYKKKLLEDFARGQLLKDRVRALVQGKHTYLNLLRKTNPSLYKIRLIELSRKALLDMHKNASYPKFDDYALETAKKIIENNMPVFMRFLREMKKGEGKFKATVSIESLKREVEKAIKPR